MPAILDFKKPHVLRNEEEYSAAVERVDELLRLDIEDGSEEAEELLFLAVLIEEYEDREHSIEGATPQEVVDFALDQRGMQRSELAEVMGGGSRVSDFFNGKRELSKNQARALHEMLRIPLELLLA
jgi:HTH-type transcriptional regulator / antitoxin HigA